MVVATDIDYSVSGLTIQQAMVAHVKRYPDKKSRPETILWGTRRVRTSDFIHVPSEGVVRLEFFPSSQAIRQDERFEDVVEYPFFARDGLLWTWNVYESTYPGGQKVEEKWTENSGFWVELNGENERVYHCSHGGVSPPDFDSFVYKLTIKGQFRDNEG